MSTLPIAVVQMKSSEDLEGNLRSMERWTALAARAGAKLVTFPELAYFSGQRQAWIPLIADYAKIVARLSSLASEHGVYLLPGSLREPVPGQKDRFFNTSPVIDPSGKCLAAYRKIFLFKARLPDRNYDEGEYSQAGDQMLAVRTPWGSLGLSICYDLRFPELFRALRELESSVVFVPAAFTVPTGKAHWEPLLRARAIENAYYVVASGQTGKNGDGAEKYGHSLVVSPWGEVLCDLGTEEGFRVVTLDQAAIQEARRKVDSWASCRTDLFPRAFPNRG